MNLVLLLPEDFISEQHVRLTGRRLEHIVNVHRAKLGDTLRVGVLNEKVGRGLITALDNQTVEIEVSLEQEPPPKLPLTIVVALPRPKVLNRVIASATCLGASRMIILNAWKVEKSYWKSLRLSEANLLHQRIIGLEQAGDTVLPKLYLARFFAPFVQNELPVIASQTLRLVAHPLAIVPCPACIIEPCTLVIGPEGGFIPNEIQALEKIGFEPVSLGTRTLRTETAMAALIGRLYL
ncbi:MAG: 16S rRNA (uracil(1498)-N(3))-methyltransferase [Holophagaceae bacterium]|nr:16S rRNA (uracil(1498)-N(3))-methyltransferase [Holophagaceae bacterium]